MEIRERASRNLHSPTISDTTVVSIINGGKWYKLGDKVLDGLNLNVPLGSIYGLLGSSGCGKTTILSCILGNQKLNHGDILIFGDKPGAKGSGVPGRNVGYMPQETSLYKEFSISENLAYFGGLVGMTTRQVEMCLRSLNELLGLPGDDRRIGTFSAGEQRRVSLATALIHNPKLLILDEPTVGLDPLIRQRVWLYLKKLVATKQTTVVITTHYIDECGEADLIGFIKHGDLLLENSPARLYAQFGSNSLEKILLLVCKRSVSGASLESISHTSIPADTRGSGIGNISSSSMTSSFRRGSTNMNERMSESHVTSWRRTLA